MFQSRDINDVTSETVPFFLITQFAGHEASEFHIRNWLLLNRTHHTEKAQRSVTDEGTDRNGEKPPNPHPNSADNFPQNQSSSSSSTPSIQDSNPEMVVDSFPQELITEILLKLPVKSLLKFKCVSKTWLSFITNPQFIKSHFRISKSKANPRLLMWSIFRGCYYLRDSLLTSVLNEDASDAKDLEFPDGRNDRYVSYVGDCNGVICVAIGDKDLFLWNPSIKKSEKFPNLDADDNDNDDYDDYEDQYYVVYGFGYNEVNDDYVVGSIICLLGDVYRPTGEVKVYVCSMRNKSWRRIGNFEGGYPWKSNRGIFVNGKLHWAVDKGVCGSIVSLDLATESYGTMDEPKYEKCRTRLGVFEECLCLLLCNRAAAQLEVWVMKEYRVKESWTKALAIRCNPLRNFMSTPLCVAWNGEYLLVLGRELGLYNPEDNTFKQLRDFVGTIYTASLCVESLVLPSAADAPEGQ